MTIEKHSKKGNTKAAKSTSMLYNNADSEAFERKIRERQNHQQLTKDVNSRGLPRRSLER